MRNTQESPSHQPIHSGSEGNSASLRGRHSQKGQAESTFIRFAFFILLMIVLLAILYLIAGKLKGTSGGLPWA